jgi:thymidine kinase
MMGSRLYGRLEVIVGPMFSGKTSELQRRVRRARIAKLDVAVVKPDIDTRYLGVTAHTGATEAAVILPADLSNAVGRTVQLSDADLVAFDEAQFFSSHLVDLVESLINDGCDVVVAGLDLDSHGRPFGSLPALLALADHVDKLSAVCTRCGEDATRSQRLTTTVDQVEVGNSYEARCRDCWSDGRG